MMYSRRSSLLWTVTVLCAQGCVNGFTPAAICPTKKSSACFAVEKPTEEETASRPFYAGDDDNVATAPKPAPSKGSEIIKSETQWEILGAIWDVAGDIARQIFFSMRRTAAGALTASLPENEREELLERTFGKEKVAQAKSSQEQDDGYARSMSVQENVAAAVVKETQRDPTQWEKEKADIFKQAEKAANDRVETELAIQKQRMEQEKKQLQQDQESLQQQLATEKQSLEQMKAEIVEQQGELRAKQQIEQQESAAAIQEQQVKLAAMEEALREKEEQAEQDRAKVAELAQALELASSGISASTDDEEEDDDKPRIHAERYTPEEYRSADDDDDDDDDKPRIHAGRYTPEEYRSLTDEEKEQVRLLREQLGTPSLQADTAESGDSDDVHPILGPVVEDLGYKRIHLLSAGKLGTIPIWKKQRIYRHERAKAMVEDKWKSMGLGLPGVICLHEDKDGKLSIIDGQHRVGMMMLLRDKQRKMLEGQEDTDDDTNTIDFDRVLVEVYPHQEAYEDGDDGRHTQDLFLEINKAEPIKLVDMPGVAKAKDRKILTSAVDDLFEMFPEMFSPSQRCRTPNVNVDNLRNQLFGADVMKRHNLTTSKKLVEWILEQNQLLAEKYESSEEANRAISPRAWKKASANKFYLGLESSWLYN